MKSIDRHIGTKVSVVTKSGFSIYGILNFDKEDKQQVIISSDSVHTIQITNLQGKIYQTYEEICIEIERIEFVVKTL